MMNLILLVWGPHNPDSAARSVCVLLHCVPIFTSSCGQGAACSFMELQLYLWSALVLWLCLPCTLIQFKFTNIFSGSKLQNLSLILMQCIFRVFYFPGVQFQTKTYLTDAPTSQLWFIMTIINSKILQQKKGEQRSAVQHLQRYGFVHL